MRDVLPSFSYSDCFVHLYVERLHCFNLSIVGPTAATAAADDADNLDISGIDIRRSADVGDVSSVFDECC